MIRNLIPLIYTPELIASNDTKIRGLRHLINAFTASACNAMLAHLSLVKRGDFTENDIPTLDQRNELDAETEGDEVSKQLMAATGIATPSIPPYLVSQLCDGIRFSLYQHLHAYGEFSDDKTLYREPKVVSLVGKINYDQPMSAEMYMNYRVKMASTVNDNEVKAMYKARSKVSHGITEELVRAAFTEAAVKNQQRLDRLMPEVLTELASFNDVYDEDAFMHLPTEWQLRIGQHVQRSFNNEYKRILPRLLRDQTLAGECACIEASIDVLTQWLTEVEHTQALDQLQLGSSSPRRLQRAAA